MLKILQISDLHILPNESDTLLGVNTGYYFQQVLRQAHLEHGPFDLILASGDLGQYPCRESYQRIMEQFRHYRTLTLCLPGNHDDIKLMQTVLNDGMISCRKRLQLQNWQLFCLNSQKSDSPNGELSKSELLYLKKGLAAQPQIPTLIAMHHHCISSGSDWLDSMQISNSAELLEIVSHHSHVKAITFGHIHQEISADLNGIGIYSAPSSCFQFKPRSKEFSVDETSPGYRVFELFDDGRLSTACFRISEPLLGLIKEARTY